MLGEQIWINFDGGAIPLISSKPFEQQNDLIQRWATIEIVECDCEKRNV